jgi:SAM-dependent methyltransferase
MVERDVKAFWENDAAQHMGFAYQYGRNPEVRYPMYEIRHDLVLNILQGLPKGRLLDAGCGAAHILADCLDHGWDGHGFDFAENMVALARTLLEQHGQATERVRVGVMNDLSYYGDRSFDVVLLLGVSQYLAEKDDVAIWSEIHRVLKPEGVVLIDFVNALFDLSTFNRFTVRFVVDEFVRLFFPPERVPDIEKRISALVTYPQKPDVTGLYATRRDHVTKRTENPLTVAARMKSLDFDLADLQFYRFHAVPPLLFETDPDLEKVAIAKEFELSRNWIGHFTASAFLVTLKRA